MSVPKKRISKRRTRARRSHHGVAVAQTIASPIPGDTSAIKPHHAHEYNGRMYSWKEIKELLKKQPATNTSK